MNRVGLHNFYSGRVQGVGFRMSVKSVASGFDVVGVVRNVSDGRVELVAEGDKAELVAFLEAIRESEVRSFIRSENTTWGEATNLFRGFEISR